MSSDLIGRVVELRYADASWHSVPVAIGRIHAVGFDHTLEVFHFLVLTNTGRLESWPAADCTLGAAGR